MQQLGLLQSYSNNLQILLSWSIFSGDYSRIDWFPNVQRMETVDAGFLYRPGTIPVAQPTVSKH